MNLELHLAEAFGSYLAEGARAAEYRLRHIEPVFDVYETFVLDFAGIRGANSSFANALIVPLFAQHGAAALKKLKFRNCNPTVKLMIQGALTMGTQAIRTDSVRA